MSEMATQFTTFDIPADSPGSYAATKPFWRSYPCIVAGKSKYPTVVWEGKTVRLSRLAFYLKYGIWPVFACHHCDEPRCVQIMHLFNGTAKDNNIDAVKKGRNIRKVENFPRRERAEDDSDVPEFDPTDVRYEHDAFEHLLVRMDPQDT